jgi:hypothetical protein
MFQGLPSNADLSRNIQLSWNLIYYLGAFQTVSCNPLGVAIYSTKSLNSQELFKIYLYPIKVLTGQLRLTINAL